jgi:hypothetical protein
MKHCAACVIVGFLSLVMSLAQLTFAQMPTQTASALPRLVRLSGTVKDLNGNPLTGVVGITFALYTEQTGGAALWLETQNVTADSNGHYTAVLGSTKPDGLPAELFTSEQARWVGVQVSGQAEQPRVLLVSAPYAFKAGDAETVGGLPSSAFVLANAAGSKTEAVASGSAATPKAGQRVPPPANPNVTGKGTIGYVPTWDSTSDIVDSVIFQKTSEIGIGTTTPAATLDVKGKTDVRDTLTLFPKGTDSTLAINGTTFKVDPTGKVTFIAGQTFPGAGTITGITTAAGSGLSGGGTKGTLSLKVPAAGITNAMLADSGITLNANTAGGLTTPGAMTLGSTYTMGLKACAANQVLQYNGTSWACASAGTGTVTSVGSGTGLTGGPITGSGTLSLASNACAAGSALSALPFTCSPFATLGANTFTGNQAIAGFNLQTYIGNPGCGSHPFAGIAFGSSGFQNCGNYSIVGDSVNTYIAAPTGDIYFRTAGNTVTAMTIAPSGTVLTVTGLTAATGSALSGTDAVEGVGGNGDPNNTSYGGVAVVGTGGTGVVGSNLLGGPGSGGFFTGGNCSNCAGNGDVFGGDGVDATPGVDYDGQSPDGYAGNFTGDLNVTGAIFAGTKDFKIDHPLDPANKYLVHASVESSEMMNIYTGNVTTDSAGHATVQLPEWFEVLNTDFRYQLTVIGQFAQAIIGRKIENNRFEIRTSAPNVEVSWQVTGVRQDAYAKANPLVVEQEKEARLRGFYIHPELYGAPAEKQIEWARHPQTMKKMQEVRARQLAASQKQAAPRN